MRTIKNENATKNENDAAARLEMLKKETAELEKQLARGTSDITREALLVMNGGATLPERIEAMLRTKPHSIDDLARELKMSTGKVAAAIKPMRSHLFNAGTEHEPAWFWIVSDRASATEINNAVVALVSYRPMYFAELLAATGARQGRVSGAIVALQRDSKSRIANINKNPLKARWFLVPEGIALAKLRAR